MQTSSAIENLLIKNLSQFLEVNFDTTSSQIANSWKWDRRTTEKFLKVLEVEKMIKRFKINPESKKSCTLT